MDFLERLKEHMEGLAYTPSVVEMGTYKEDGNSLAIRPAPSNINTRYMTKGKIYPFSFQLLSHNSSNTVAYTTLQKLLKEYDLLDSSSIASADQSFDLISIKCTTTPNFVESTTHGTLWTAIFEAELYII